MNPLRILACALTVAVLSPMAQAQTEADLYPISFPISVDGKAATLHLALHLPLSPVTSETLPDGTQHHQFTSVVSDPYEWSSAWKIAYEPLDFGWYGPPQPYKVDTYLTPTGSSRLAFDWGYQVDCHGGCYRTAHLRFDLASSTGGLFGDTLQDLNFANGSDVHGTGYERIVTTPNFGGGQTIGLTRFSVGTVPEPEDLTLVVAGLMAAGLARRRPWVSP